MTTMERPDLPAPSRTIRVAVPQPNPDQLLIDAFDPEQRERNLQEQFERFHQQNPHVYAELCRLARRLARAGASRVGMKMLFEVLRYRHTLATRGGDGVKLNNNMTSRYARLISAQEPDLDGLFETRELHSP